MKIGYEQRIYLFKKIYPHHLYSSFSFEELNSFDNVNISYCFDDEIVKIGKDYYKYSGETISHWNNRKESIIRFTSRTKTIKEITV